MNLSLKLNNSLTAGLDIGKSSTKLVVLRNNKGATELVNKAIFHNREEGLMDDIEVVEYLEGWIREQGAELIETRIGLPQYMAMTQISDFPNATESQLEEMVEYETRQLAGLTDEVFIHDYIRLNPFATNQNPVLMGVCRQSIIENRIDLVGTADLSLAAIHMNGQAIADAYIETMPDDDSDKLVMLLDIGGENTTLALVQNGQLIYVGSFLFGGDFFNDALAKEYGINAGDAERMKLKGSLTMEGETDSPLLVEARAFSMELDAALENSSVYDPLVNNPPVHKIYLSGGGSLFNGFDAYIAQHYQVPVEPLELPSFNSKEESAFYTTAYGLALQGVLGAKHQTISLTPAIMEYTALRRKRRHLPVMSLILLGILCVGYIGLNLLIQQVRHGRLNKDSKRLAECKKIAGPLESNVLQITQYEEMLMPFAARGNRSARVNAALYEVSKARMQGCWFYYAADPLTFVNREENLEVLGRDPEDEVEEGDSIFNIFIAAQRREPSDRICVMARSVQPWEGLVFAGFVPLDDRDRMKNIRKIRQQLAESPVFDKVDLLAEVTESESNARQPWMPFGMIPFRLGCRFSDIEFKPRRVEVKDKK